MFFKKKNFSRKDRNLLLTQIQDQYLTLPEITSKGRLTIDHFHRRYDDAVKQGMDEEDFLKEELQSIQSLVEKLKSKKAHIQPSKATGTIEKIVSEMSSRYKKYRRIKIGKNAPEEIEYLLGCLVEFFDRYQAAFSFLSRKILHREAKKKFSEFDYTFQELCHPTRQGLPKQFYDFKYSITRDGDLDEYQRLAQPLLKETFNLLMKILDWIHFLGREVEQVRRLSYSLNAKSVSFSELSLELKRDIDQVLDAFRLKGLI